MNHYIYYIVIYNSTQIVMLTGYFALAEFKINVLVNYATNFPRYHIGMYEKQIAFQFQHFR